MTPEIEPVYQLKISLQEIEPPIWRRVRVRGGILLSRLHSVIQKAMGWQDVHLHEFTIRNVRYGRPEPDEPHYEVEAERNFSLRELAPLAGMRFEHVYDLGDGWQHEWRWFRLTDLARLEAGHTPSRSHPEWWGEPIPGSPLVGKKRPLILARFEEFFRLAPDRTDSERSWTVERAAIEAKGYDLKAVNPHAKKDEDVRTPGAAGHHRGQGAGGGGGGGGAARLVKAGGLTVEWGTPQR